MNTVVLHKSITDTLDLLATVRKVCIEVQKGPWKGRIKLLLDDGVALVWKIEKQ